VINFKHAKGICPRRLTKRKRIKSRAKDRVLLQASFNALGEAILSVPVSYQKTRALLLRVWMAENGCEPFIIASDGIDEARRNRVSQDFWLLIRGLMNRPHDRAQLARPTWVLHHVRLHTEPRTAGLPAGQETEIDREDATTLKNALLGSLIVTLRLS
jgi:hypothetical protein